MIVCLIFSLNSSKSSNFKSIPPVLAIANKCKKEFVEPPNEKSAIIALRKDCLVIISNGHKFSFTISTILIPLSKAILLFCDDTEDAVAHSGSDIPITSVKQAIVLAVYIPWQEPAVGQDFNSNSSNSSFEICPER